MPTYDYRCGACRHVFEVFERLNARGPRDCPRCGKQRARRQMGCGAAPVIRGAGSPAPRGG